jgi:hypothetical protein
MRGGTAAKRTASNAGETTSHSAGELGTCAERHQIVRRAALKAGRSHGYSTFERCYGNRENSTGLDLIRSPMSEVHDEFFEGVELPAVREIRALFVSKD